MGYMRIMQVTCTRRFACTYSARLDLPAVITFGDISLEAATRMYPLNYCTACSGADHDEQHPDLNYLA